MDNSSISRQAAIDAIDVLCQEHRYRIPGKAETYSQYNEAWQDALDRAEGAIFDLPSAQPEITQDQLEEYCKKRCLTVITDDLFYQLTSGSKETTEWVSCGEFWEHRSGLEKFKCNCCGGEVILYFGAKYPNFCPYCGRKSIADTGYERKIEDRGYGFMLITGRRKDED